MGQGMGRAQEGEEEKGPSLPCLQGVGAAGGGLECQPLLASA